ncbi:MAG: citrate lyase holo-[acyl-carrier protein] synthase [Bacilli bacterium]|jgi:holo-ACP synthase/triphosphoribosyl-dephospho-CoA synthase|nr:citrate lyase holo-[acyl-carrier protein] synthase [Sphaerochaetaceae bacterium]
MKYKEYRFSPSVNLEDILAARDFRTTMQKDLIEKYQLPLVVFTLNIAGPVKVFDLTRRTFYEGMSMIKEKLFVNNFSIFKEAIYEKITGYEAYLLLDGDANNIKYSLLEVEEDTSLGRLFDIDVFDITGDKLCRTNYNKSFRKCLICDNVAFECGRSRKHSVDEVLEKEIEIMLDYFNQKYATKLSQIALKSLLYEINTTPKPGLVDLNNNGAHTDLTVYLLQKSAICLEPFFKKFVYVGINNKEEKLSNILPKLRILGKSAEYRMFKTTKNINTHKGAIFIFSIVLCSLGWLYANNIAYSREGIEKTIKELSTNILNDFSYISRKKHVTHGEEVFIKYNILGIRGEAASGFHSLFTSFITCLNNQLQKHSFNDSGVYTLLNIIMGIDDTNMISRSDYETVTYFKEEIHNAMSRETIDIINFASNLDKEFIHKGISAGGSADLLALTYFIYFYEREVDVNLDRMKS